MAAAGTTEETARPTDLEAWVAASRARCGLGPKIADESTLLRAAGAVAAALRRREEGGRRAGP